MHYFISAIPFLFLFYVPTAAALVDKNDDTFLAFVKGDPNQNNEVLIQMYEARLGLMYLMRENWKCAEIRKEIKQETKECEKLRKYLDILYGYLFRVYAEGTGAAADQTVKPVFKFNEKVGTIIEVLEKLSQLSRFFFVPGTKEQLYNAPVLSNEGEMNYALKAANSNGTLRQQFDKKLEKMLENTKKNAAKERAELKKIERKSQQGNPRSDADKRNISDAISEYGTKFDIILMSPFMSVGLDDPDGDSLSGLMDTFMANDQ